MTNTDCSKATVEWKLHFCQRRLPWLSLMSAAALARSWHGASRLSVKHQGPDEGLQFIISFSKRLIHRHGKSADGVNAPRWQCLLGRKLKDNRVGLTPTSTQPGLLCTAHPGRRCHRHVRPMLTSRMGFIKLKVFFFQFIIYF